jgi:hypothetical protein
LLHLLPHIPRDKLDRRLHFGKHTLGFLDTLQTSLAEPYVLGNSTHNVNLLLDISRNELPIATHTSLQIDKVVRTADSADTLSDLLSLLAEALVLLASHFSFLLELLQACGVLWRAPRTTFLRLAACALTLSLHLLKPLLSLRGGFAGRPLLRGHGT